MSWLKNQPNTQGARPLAATGNLVFGSRLAKEPFRARGAFEEIFGARNFDKDALTGLLEGVRSTGYNQRMMRTYGEVRGRTSRDSTTNSGNHGAAGNHGSHSSREHTPHASHGMSVVRGVRTSTPLSAGKHYTSTRYRPRRGVSSGGTSGPGGYGDRHGDVRGDVREKVPSSAPCGPQGGNELGPHALMGRKFLRNNGGPSSSNHGATNASANNHGHGATNHGSGSHAGNGGGANNSRDSNHGAHGHGAYGGTTGNNGQRRASGFHQDASRTFHQEAGRTFQQRNRDMNLTLSGFGNHKEEYAQQDEYGHQQAHQQGHQQGGQHPTQQQGHGGQPQGNNIAIMNNQQQQHPGQQLCVQRPRAFGAEDANPGFRPAMEDAYIVRDNFGGDPQWSYYGCYDGHGGRQVVDYTLANMHDIFAQELIKSNFDRQQMPKIFERAFQNTDNQLRQLSAWHCGTTCTVGLIYTPAIPQGQQSGPIKRTLYIGNVGDSRGSMVNASTGGERLTVDHKATDPQEHARVTHEGGLISRGRVGGQLMLTRALGDFAFKSSGVIAKPYFATREMRPDDVCVVLASDGLWDVMDEDDVARIVLAGKSKKFDIKRVPQNLVDMAKARGSADNITALVIFV